VYKNNISWISGQAGVDRQGQFGDMFGALNTLITTFGFVGLLISLHLQRKQFQASLSDMRDNALASEHQANAMVAQTRALEVQNKIAVVTALLNSAVTRHQTAHTKSHTDSMIATELRAGSVTRRVRDLEKELEELLKSANPISGG
jgi:hypothetical protein